MRILAICTLLFSITVCVYGQINPEELKSGAIESTLNSIEKYKEFCTAPQLDLLLDASKLASVAETKFKILQKYYPDTLPSGEDMDSIFEMLESLSAGSIVKYHANNIGEVDLSAFITFLVIAENMVNKTFGIKQGSN